MNSISPLIFAIEKTFRQPVGVAIDRPVWYHQPVFFFSAR